MGSSGVLEREGKKGLAAEREMEKKKKVLTYTIPEITRRMR